MEALDQRFGGSAEAAVHRDGAEERVVLGDAVQLALDGGHGGAAVAPAQGAAGVAGGDGLDVLGAHDLHAAAVIIAQDLQGIAALVGQGHGAPLLHAGAGDGFAVAVFGVVRFHVSAAAHIGVENVVGDALHHVKNRAAVHKVLVVTGGVGDVEAVPLAGVPFGVNAVEGQADLGVDVGPKGLLRPGGVHLAGGHVGDVFAEGYGHVAGTGRGLAQVHRDVFWDDDLIQHLGAVLGVGAGAGAALARIQGMGRNLHRFDPLAAGSALVDGDHLQGGQGSLAGEDLDALNDLPLPALFFGGQGHSGVGLGAGVLGEGERLGRRFNGKVGGSALGVGEKGAGKAWPGDGDQHLRHGGGEPLGEALHPQSALLIHNKLLCLERDKRLCAAQGAAQGAGAIRRCCPRLSICPWGGKWEGNFTKSPAGFYTFYLALRKGIGYHKTMESASDERGICPCIAKCEKPSGSAGRVPLPLTVRSRQPYAAGWVCPVRTLPGDVRLLFCEQGGSLRCRSAGSSKGVFCHDPV